MKRFLLIGAVLGSVWPGGASAAPLSDCAGHAIVSAARVRDVDKDGALVLDHGTAWLEGIRLPALDDPSAPIATQALAGLRRLAMAAPITLAAVQPGTDRYGRLRAQAFGIVWLQLALLDKGLARVEIAPDGGACAAIFYRAEAQARNAATGLWSLPRYRIQKAGSLPVSLAGRYELVEGKVEAVSVRGTRLFLDFGRDDRRGFSAVIASGDRRKFRKAKLVLKDLAGRQIRIRGIIEDYRGRPEIALSSPYQVEVLR